MPKSNKQTKNSVAKLNKSPNEIMKAVLAYGEIRKGKRVTGALAALDLLVDLQFITLHEYHVLRKTLERVRAQAKKDGF